MADDMLVDAMSGFRADKDANMGARLKTYAELEHKRRDLEAQLKAVEQQSRELGDVLLDDFGETGMSNANVDGLCVYIRMDRYVSKKSDATMEQVCAALREAGLAYMVSDGYNAASLKSLIKEYNDSCVEVPPKLAELLNVGEVPRLATRSAK